MHAQPSAYAAAHYFCWQKAAPEAGNEVPGQWGDAHGPAPLPPCRSQLSPLHLQPHTCTTSPAISPVCCSKGTSAQRAPRCHSLPQCIQAGLFKSNSCRLLLCHSHSSFCKGVGLELAQPYSALPPTPYHDAGQSLPSHCLRSPTGITGN